MIPLGVLASKRVVVTGGGTPGEYTAFTPITGTWDPNGADPLEIFDPNTSSGSQMVASGTAPVRADLTMTPLAIPGGTTVTTVVLSILKRATTTGTSVFDLGLIIGGTVYYSLTPNSNNSINYDARNFTFATNPATAAAWTPAGVNSITGIAINITDSVPPPAFRNLSVGIT